jgi:hypothetical protein
LLDPALNERLRASDERHPGSRDGDELSLVAVFDGIDLKIRAEAFKGGSVLAWFGGINVDLRTAELAAGTRLSVHTLFGGIAITTRRAGGSSRSRQWKPVEGVAADGADSAVGERVRLRRAEGCFG